VIEQLREHSQQYRKLLNQPVLLLLLVLTGVYLHGANLQNHLVNIDSRQTDQGSYLTFAREMRKTNYDYLVPRNQMPVYPLLQSLVYRPGMTNEEFFAAGKDFNVFLSLVILAALYWLFQRYFPPLMTLNLMLITGFTIFMFKAPFFQAELVFYLLHLIVFLLMLQMIREPTVRAGTITGLVLGITHMTKASIMLGLIVFVLFMGAGILVDFFNRVPNKTIVRHKVLPLFLLLLTFLASISVYVSNSKKVYGHYFYNVNSTFYIWYDNWSQAKAGTIAHGDRYGWPDMPADEVPGPLKYLREHSLGQIVGRVQIGLLRVLSNSMLSYGYFIYLMIYTLVISTFSFLNWRRCLEKIKQHYLLVFFAAAYLLLYLLAIAWYSPIASGNRFILASFLPYMFVLFYVLRSTERYFGTQAGRFLKVINLIVLCLLTGHIVYIMTNKISTFYGGL
jgi:hypothetical protein